MTAADATARVKRKFHIPQSVTTFDDDVVEAVTIAVDCLAPFASNSAPADLTKTLATGASTVAWDFLTQDIDKIFYRVSSSDVWQLVTGWYHDDDTLYFTDLTGAVSLKILPRAPYIYAAIDQIPQMFLPSMIDFACSEFASFIAGSQAKFDNYVQATGARATDSMINLSEFYETRANMRVREVADAGGSL